MEIRNFVIIAHVDHGKSTLADRLLEATHTVSAHKMKAQYLDALELERERGITIKMAPVRMKYGEYILNLIDTPGHSDFSYEVSRSLGAVEGAVLLVDITQGAQAQTLANLDSARRAGLKIIGAINKIDLNPAGADTASEELASLLGCKKEEIHRVSGKTGEGVEGLLQDIARRVPGPKIGGEEKSALIFSSTYNNHKGVIAYVRVFGGKFKAGENVKLLGVNESFKIKEVGYFTPEFKPADALENGEIGYIATGIKDPDIIKIGDTVGSDGGTPLSGFKIPQPVVFVSIYPDESDDYDDLKFAFGKLRLGDSSLSFAPDFNEVLGRGFKCGFLGKLHMEITIQRLEREFGLKTVNSFPSVAYLVKTKDKGEFIAETPQDFPADYLEAKEPMANLEVLIPGEYLGAFLGLKNEFKLENITTDNYLHKIKVRAALPLSELIADFDDRLKSISSGFASFSYEITDFRSADLRKLDVLVAGEPLAGLSRIVHKEDVESVGRNLVVRLKDLLPKVQFTQALQAIVGGKIIARETIPALQKRLGYFGKTGGDRTRKMKLWKKQKEGKARLKERGRVSVPAEAFKELLKK
ncbi:MAG: elongation factor 4 [Candidatus Colwellbacteria bacterium]|nr:elongation factor 4 [Candidatus Colwellbacteria bacterium]